MSTARGVATVTATARGQPSSTTSANGSGGVPLELVKYDTTTGRFIVGAEALAVLRGTRGPVGVVAVCGRARQGKSYILNQLLQATSGQGFTVCMGYSSAGATVCNVIVIVGFGGSGYDQRLRWCSHETFLLQSEWQHARLSPYSLPGANSAGVLEMVHFATFVA
jgi:hypothetical protein